MQRDFIQEWLDDSPTVTLHTSGSTGVPKTIVAEKSRMISSARNTCNFLGLKNGDKALLCMSTDFIGGKMMIVRSLVCGLELTTIPPTGHPMADAKDMDYDLAAMVPLQVYNSLQVPSEKKRLMSIKNLLIGGGEISSSLAYELHDFPNAVWSTYGMTETLSHIALRKLNGRDADAWYTPLENIHISLNQDNCIVVEAPDIIPTPLVTNDIGVLAPDGKRFRIIGRKDNVICSGGIKIQIEEIEQLLSNHLDCNFMISKRTDDKFGEITVMLIAGDILKAQAICESVLPKYLQPKQYIKVSNIPLTPTGKPARDTARKICETFDKNY